MDLFWQEYLLFIVYAFSALVCIAAAWLFLLTFGKEKKLQTVWRSVGFFALAIGFIFFILERKYSIYGFFGVVIELFGFFSIYKGVLAEPKLKQLIAVEKEASIKEEGKKILFGKVRFVSSRDLLQTLFLIVLLIALAVLLYFYPFSRDYVFAGLVGLSVLFILATIRIQIVRLLATDRKNKAMIRQNIYPLAGYVFLFFRGFALIFYRLPELDVVFLRKLVLDYSFTWQAALVFTFLGFLFLGIWAWNFIRVRVALRIYIVILAIAVLLSTLGSAVFSTLVFNIVENNNLQLMVQGAKSQNLILENNSNTSLIVARTMANDPRVLNNVISGNYESLSDLTENYLLGSDADIMRIYSTDKQIVVSPSDVRDEGRILTDDDLLNRIFETNNYLNVFDTHPGVLSDVIVARALYPIIDDDVLLGVVEVGYKFDNAFVDFAGEKTGTDVTIYSAARRSATTIKTLDGVSRWVGSEETDGRVIENVLIKGNIYATEVDRLGISYYSAFKPVRNVDGMIIGMVSVGTPTVILLENLRQQLLSTFLIVTAISIFLALLGDLAIYGVFKTKRK